VFEEKKTRVEEWAVDSNGSQSGYHRDFQKEFGISISRLVALKGVEVS
jgi:methylphosphotriester-DNA--protein-cysteine methyltransferase